MFQETANKLIDEYTKDILNLIDEGCRKDLSLKIVLDESTLSQANKNIVIERVNKATAEQQPETRALDFCEKNEALGVSAVFVRRANVVFVSRNNHFAKWTHKTFTLQSIEIAQAFVRVGVSQYDDLKQPNGRDCIVITKEI